MRIYLDTEFTELSQNAQLISLALVDEAGRSFYAEFSDYDPGLLSAWHQEHVLDNLLLQALPSGQIQQSNSQTTYVKGDAVFIRQEIEAFIQPYEQLEVWGDNHAYDWVFFCQLWGGALHIPKLFFYIVFDLPVLLLQHGIHPDTPRAQLVDTTILPAHIQALKPHNALYDTHLLRQIVRQLMA